ncbi:acyltransferase [Vibrio sp. SM6]|uniref:Acyltransferase n=1 Tax=Vibrio agarilyticus TaxID=2726741 RepID=A0A7X8TQI8_9VIBR|nr:acyltransferase [Vibrio agarilyticus]
MHSTQTLRHWLKHSPHPVARRLFIVAKSLLGLSAPAPKVIVVPLYKVTVTLQQVWATVTRVFLWTPIFKGRIDQVGANLYLYGGMPFVTGPLKISLGKDNRISGATTFSGRVSALHPPELLVGDNVDIGWQTTIAVGKRVIIGDNARIAGRAFLAGYPGHPINPYDRAAGLPELDEQVGDIILERNVWLATGVSVMAGVTVGENSVIAAGSVVTHSIPANVVAGGVPAKVLRPLTKEEQLNSHHKNHTESLNSGASSDEHSTHEQSTFERPSNKRTSAACINRKVNDHEGAA